ncbi:MAG: sulfotransferase family protein [Gammaproteobacteria bacterium]|nr:sulfotransferase family protein [Gammaproteobacteria bacterium]
MTRHRILALWAVPRSTSTAFEWMMRQRGDLRCFHEPFGEAWYQGEAPLWPRVTEDSARTPGLTLESVRRQLAQANEDGPVFIKDFPHYIDHMIDDALLDLFNHCFLIRDPAKTITSLYARWPDFHEKEVGSAEQRALFDRLCERDGKAPPVLDSDDLLERPAQMVAAWCAACGIEFIPEALNWKAGARDAVSWWDGGSFHENLRHSTGLRPQARSKYIDIDEAPGRVRAVHASVVEHYEHLHAHRLRGS